MSRELLCEVCDRDYVIWFAPSDIWNATCRGGKRGAPDHFNFLCPTCFTNLADAQGLAPTGWLIIPDVGGPVRYASQIHFTSGTDEELDAAAAATIPDDKEATK